MRLNIWASETGARSEVARYAAEQTDALAAHARVARISEREAGAPPDADLNLYHLANSAEHGFVYRAAMARPGVVLLHDWNLHQLVLAETAGLGDTPAYLREMRRAHGEAGAIIGSQIARGRGGEWWPALYPLNDAILGASLGVVVHTMAAAARAPRQVRGLRAIYLPRHLSMPPEVVSRREEVRRALGIPDSAFVVTAAGLGAASPLPDFAAKALARLRNRHPQILLVTPGETSRELSHEDVVRHLLAADVVVALRFPDDGSMPGGVVSALGAGRPVLMIGGTAASDAFPEGMIAPIDPGDDGVDSLESQLSRLMKDATLRERLGRAARAHVLAHHDLLDTTRALAGFLGDVLRDREHLIRAVASRRPAEGTLEARLLDEARVAAHDLGLGAFSLGIESLLATDGGPAGLQMFR